MRPFSVLNSSKTYSLEQLNKIAYAKGRYVTAEPFTSATAFIALARMYRADPNKALTYYNPAEELLRSIVMTCPGAREAEPGALLSQINLEIKQCEAKVARVAASRIGS